MPQVGARADRWRVAAVKNNAVTMSASEANSPEDPPKDIKKIWDTAGKPRYQIVSPTVKKPTALHQKTYQKQMKPKPDDPAAPQTTARKKGVA